MQQEKTNDSIEATEEQSVMLNVDGEDRSCTLEEIKLLAQKGYLYEQIEDDWERVKAMALEVGKSVREYLGALAQNRIDARLAELMEKCGDEELASYILSLESVKQDTGTNDFAKLREYFPKIRDINELPECVVAAAKQKGSHLLDELLRYRHKKQMEISNLKDLQKAASNSSIGPQREHISADYDPARLQFIKGIWGK